MPSHGKGGRKPERDEVKRAAVAVRTTSAIKARLVEAADLAGRDVNIVWARKVVVIGAAQEAETIG